MSKELIMNVQLEPLLDYGILEYGNEEETRKTLRGAKWKWKNSKKDESYPYINSVVSNRKFIKQALDPEKLERHLFFWFFIVFFISILIITLLNAFKILSGKYLYYVSWSEWVVGLVFLVLYNFNSRLAYKVQNYAYRLSEYMRSQSFIEKQDFNVRFEPQLLCVLGYVYEKDLSVLTNNELRKIAGVSREYITKMKNWVGTFFIKENSVYKPKRIRFHVLDERIPPKIRENIEKGINTLFEMRCIMALKQSKKNKYKFYS